MRPESEEGKPVGDTDYVRTGLLGFLGPGGLVFVCGSRDGLMTVSGRKHNTDDIIATVLAVEPMRFIYRGRIAVFSVKVNRVLKFFTFPRNFITCKVVWLYGSRVLSIIFNHSRILNIFVIDDSIMC